jgi:hypothetical protein
MNKPSGAAYSCIVKFMYFKQSGKYYTEGTFELSSDSPWGEFMEKCRYRKFDAMPGLSTLGEEFTFIITSEDHPQAFPAMYYPLNHYNKG